MGIVRYFMPVVTVVLMLNACASLGSKEPYSLAVSGLDSVSVKIQKQDLAGRVIGKEKVAGEVSQAILKNGDPDREYSTNNYASNGQFLGVKRAGATIRPNRDTVELTYYRGYDSATTSGEIGNSVKTYSFAVFPMSISEDKTHWVVKVAPPAEIKVEPHGILGGMEPYYRSANEYGEDIKQRLEGVKSLKLAARHIEKGEVDANYDSAAIYANYTRKFGEAKMSDGPVKEGIFLFSHKNGVEVHLRITVEPYRNGSKVRYSFDFPYSIAENIDMGKADIQAIRSRVESVATE